ncbi:MAG: PQQ-binding-like beta-propeller repeat protein [Phycisphaerae bacterium]|jgi:outer membrane protein assembly factor BamB/SAM-dependent methyltransferase|nr:PQQ-binding-like beta-propeller repeat protein [Phycisphaerae bacterium]
MLNKFVLSRRLAAVVLLLAGGMNCPIAAGRDKGPPAHHWVFDEAHVRGAGVKAVNGPSGRILGGARLAKEKGPGALVLGGKNHSVMISAASSSVDLPEKTITAEAWVAVYKPLRWGGIVGAMRDNGSDETGWVLGFVGGKFSFAIATEDKRKMTYLASKMQFTPGKWHHVVGTYDGKAHCIYVDGRLEASDSSRKGKLLYPSTDTFYEIGAYHDNNEYYRTTGRIHEAAVYKRALGAGEILARYKAKKDKFPKPDPKLIEKLKTPTTPGVVETPKPAGFRVALGPYVRYDAPGSAVVCWETADPAPSILSYGPEGQAQKQIADTTPRKAHALRLDGLRANCVYSYQVTVPKYAIGHTDGPYTFNTAFNHRPPSIAHAASPWPDAGPHQAAAERIIRDTGVTKGYCIVYGFGEGRLAYELAKRTELVVVGVSQDAASVAKARRLLTGANLYGPRITVRHAASLAKLPFTDGFANLIVSEDILAGRKCPGSAAEMFRILRPGGVAHFGAPEGSGCAAWLKAGKVDSVVSRKGGWWAVVRRDEPSGIGVWTHQYGRADNTAFGGETLRGATATNDLHVQWFGRPGADFGLDRNPRMPAPLAVNGRLFHQGMNRMIALDSQNGAPLWTLSIPDLRRVNMPRDASNWCADRDNIYVALRNACWTLDAYTGRRKATARLPDKTKLATHDWGYVARAGRKLYGSTVKARSSYTDFWKKVSWYDQRSGYGTWKICSDELFAVDLPAGKTAWTYRGGLIVNTTITIGGGKVYFSESRDAEAKASSSGRVTTDKLWSEQYLVALDAETGSKLWERPLKTSAGTVVFFLSCSDGKLVLVSSSSNKYDLYAYSAVDGKDIWHAEHKWSSNNHGAHMQHPAISGGAIFVEPNGYELATGKKLPLRMGRREGCSTRAAASGALVYRGTARRISMWDTTTGKTSSWVNLRPSCWLSVIPAGGMVLIPEGGAGCSCGNWLETSLGFAPKPKPPAKPATQTAPVKKEGK